MYANSEFMLSRNDINEFYEQGFLIKKQLYTPEEVNLIKTLLDEAFHEAQSIVAERIAQDVFPPCTRFCIEYPGPEDQSASIMVKLNLKNHFTIPHISWVGGVKPELLRLGRSPKLTIPVAQLLCSRKAVHLTNQVQFGSSANRKHEWQQEIERRKHFDPNWKDINNNGSFIQTIISLDSYNDQTGGFTVISGSHREELGLNEMKSEEKDAIICRKFDLSRQAIRLNLQPGDTLFMHTKLVHKNDANILDKSKQIFINGFSFPGANGRPYPGKGSGAMIDMSVPSQVKLT